MRCTTAPNLWWSSACSELRLISRGRCRSEWRRFSSSARSKPEPRTSITIRSNMSASRKLLRIPLAALLVTAALLAQTAKRPLTHRDYDSWRAITSQKLSPDGKWLAYGVFPQDGDGEIVIRNLVSGKEQ